MDDLSDLDLVEAAKGGDTTSFGELVRRHGPRLLAMARQLVGFDAAEDVIQEAMVDAYRGLAGFAGHAAVGTWLYRELKALDDVGGVDQLVRRVLAALADPPGPDDPLPRRA